jgi:hypothetical protein
MGNKSKELASPPAPKPRMAGDKNIAASAEAPGEAAARALAKLK